LTVLIIQTGIAFYFLFRPLTSQSARLIQLPAISCYARRIKICLTLVAHIGIRIPATEHIAKRQLIAGSVVRASA
jgi:hypothetical protein